MIKLIVNGEEFLGFITIDIYAKYRAIPNYFIASFYFQGVVPFKVNQEYVVTLNNEPIQSGFISSIKLDYSKKNGKIYTIRGVDYTNYLLHNSVGFYNYKDVYVSDIPTPVSSKKILDKFNINYIFNVDDKDLFILPNPTDNLWSVVRKVAFYTNSNAISNGSVIEFVSKNSGIINGKIVNKVNDKINNNISSSSLQIDFSQSVNKTTTFNSNVFINNENKNIKNGNNNVFYRDILFNNNIEKYSLYNREINNIDIICYNVNIDSNLINGNIPKVNKIVSVLDTDYDIDTNLLIVESVIHESRGRGIQAKLKCIDPTIISLDFFKGKLGDKFIK